MLCFIILQEVSQNYSCDFVQRGLLKDHFYKTLEILLYPQLLKPVNLWEM